ncbi:MAG: DUF3047 domain-containing protein [Candidatus Rokuibacteriota bacterium]
MRSRGGISLVVLAVAVTAMAAEVVIEDWSRHPGGTKGIPPSWQKQRWGNPAYDFTVVEDDGRKVLHLESAGDSSTISKDIKGRINLKESPILEWSWKVTALPRGADSRRKDTDDQAGQVYVTWPRFPEAVRSQVIGYIWDTTAPAGAIVKSQKTGTVTYIVLRSGSADVGKWLTERRNVREDFRKIYGEDPGEGPAILSVGIDSDDVKGTAESFMGTIRFTTP